MRVTGLLVTMVAFQAFLVGVKASSGKGVSLSSQSSNSNGKGSGSGTSFTTQTSLPVTGPRWQIRAAEDEAHSTLASVSVRCAVLENGCHACEGEVVECPSTNEDGEPATAIESTGAPAQNTGLPDTQANANSYGTTTMENHENLDKSTDMSPTELSLLAKIESAANELYSMLAAATAKPHQGAKRWLVNRDRIHEAPYGHDRLADDTDARRHAEAGLLIREKNRQELADDDTVSVTPTDAKKIAPTTTELTNANIATSVVTPTVTVTLADYHHKPTGIEKKTPSGLCGYQHGEQSCWGNPGGECCNSMLGMCGGADSCYPMLCDPNYGKCEDAPGGIIYEKKRDESSDTGSATETTNGDVAEVTTTVTGPTVTKTITVSYANTTNTTTSGEPYIPADTTTTMDCSDNATAYASGTSFVSINISTFSATGLTIAPTTITTSNSADTTYAPTSTLTISSSVFDTPPFRASQTAGTNGSSIGGSPVAATATVGSSGGAGVYHAPAKGGKGMVIAVLAGLVGVGVFAMGL